MRWLQPISILCLWGMLAWAWDAAAQLPPVPPPVVQKRVDCSRPQYASDGLVCGDATLLAADADVAALAAATDPVLANGAMWEPQDAWFRRRGLCAFQADHRGCLETAYADRKAVLDAATAAPGQALRCDGIWRGRALTAGEFTAGKAVAIAGGPTLMAVASPKPAENAQWQPLLTWHRAGKRIVLQGADGMRMTCRPALR